MYRSTMMLGLVVIATCIASLVACLESPGVDTVTPVEIWARGDDGLTLRFREALVATLRDSEHFSIAPGGKPRTSDSLADRP
jgi:hypothetical protein